MSLAMWIVLGSVILLASLSLMFAMIGVKTYEKGDLFVGGAVTTGLISIFGGLIGLLLIGTKNVHTTEMEIVESVDIIKNERVVIVDDGETLWTLESHVAYESIDSNTTFYLETEYNHYFDEIETNLIWNNEYLDEDTEKKSKDGRLYKITNKGEEKEGG